MGLLLKNFKGNVEISFEENGERSVEEIGFSVEIRHHPFFAVMDVGCSYQDISDFADCLLKMYSFELTSCSFSSADLELQLFLDMNTVGHITTDVHINAGSRGFLQFRFDFDQSFIPEIIEQIKQLSE